MITPMGEIAEEDIETLEFKLHWYLRYGNLPTTRRRDTEQAKIDYGSQYERFVGNLFETKGFRVFYNGLRNALTDGGIDLIARAPRKVRLVQCKRWRTEVSADVIARLHGAVERFIWEERRGKSAKTRISFRGVLATSGPVAQDAKMLARDWDIYILENLPYQAYPAIKAKRICPQGGRFLLPFEKDYDHTTIQWKRGDCLFFSIREAFANGFYYRPYYPDILAHLRHLGASSP